MIVVYKYVGQHLQFALYTNDRICIHTSQCLMLRMYNTLRYYLKSKVGYGHWHPSYYIVPYLNTLRRPQHSSTLLHKRIHSSRLWPKIQKKKNNKKNPVAQLSQTPHALCPTETRPMPPRSTTYHDFSSLLSLLLAAERNKAKLLDSIPLEAPKSDKTTKWNEK